MNTAHAFPADLSPVPTVLWEPYRQAWTAYTVWCTETRRQPLPPDEDTVLAYMQVLGRRSNPAQIWVWHAALALAATRRHPAARLPPSRAAAQLLDALTAASVERGWRPSRLPPEPPETIRAAVDTCYPVSPAGLRDASLILLAFLTCQPLIQFASYRLTDLEFTATGMALHRRTGSIHVAANPDHPAYCPVATTVSWVRELTATGHTTGALYRPVNSRGLTPANATGDDYRLPLSAMQAMVARAGQRAGLKLGGLALRRTYLAWLRRHAADPAALTWMITGTRDGAGRRTP